MKTSYKARIRSSGSGCSILVPKAVGLLFKPKQELIVTLEDEDEKIKPIFNYCQEEINGKGQN